MSWTIKTLRKHFNSKLKALKTANTLARKNMERRLEGMNEFRDQLTNQAGTFATKESVDERFETRDVKIEALQRMLYTGLGIMIAVELLIGVIIAVVYR